MDKIKRKFGKEIVIAEIINTVKEFKWRLCIDEFHTEWSKHYEGILTIRSQKTDNLYGYASDYWNGILPHEEPFLITKGQ